MTLTMFALIQERIFYALHLLMQDHELQGGVDDRLLYLGYCFACNMDSEHSHNYIDYYLRKDAHLAQQYKDDTTILLIPALKPSQTLSPSLTRTENILSSVPLDIKTWAF